MQTGSSRSKAKTAEILDPSTQKAISCSIEDYPLEVEEVAAAVVGGVPMSCGGYQGGSKGTSDKCFKLQGGQWIEIGQLKQKRRRSAAAEVKLSQPVKVDLNKKLDSKKKTIQIFNIDA